MGWVGARAAQAGALGRDHGRRAVKARCRCGSVVVEELLDIDATIASGRALDQAEGEEKARRVAREVSFYPLIRMSACPPAAQCGRCVSWEWLSTGGGGVAAGAWSCCVTVHQST